MFRKPPAAADICLLLEGTYPYVAGGVSTWVHQLLTAFPQWKFAILYLGAERQPHAKPKYTIPANVVAIEEVYLFEQTASRCNGTAGTLPDSWSSVYQQLRSLFSQSPCGTATELDLIASMMQHIMEHRGVSFEEFFHSTQTWAVLRDLYTRFAPEDSFLHFFWTCRYLVEPLWKLARAMPRIPKARVYHSACTGYAGIVGAVVASRRGAPLLLSEHGIYLKERIQDIIRSPWIDDPQVLRPALTEPLGSLKRLWIDSFDLLGRLCYGQASHLVSLFDRNARTQEHFGAARARLSIVPNGIRVEHYDVLCQQREARRTADPASRVVGFLGRVVSIKDIKTLLRAARLVCDELRDAQFLIAGPVDEEPQYHDECLDLVQQLQLSGSIHFLGLRNREEVLPRMDVMVLTSVSEGLPFVLLEAMASGIPIVTTDAGACRELVEGRSGDDAACGACGIVTEVGATEQIARALVSILPDRDLQKRMSRSGRERVERHYHERNTLDRYQRIYTNLLHGSLAAALPAVT
jgi:glycosyltransferase involved in cell wall biosynthesis